MSHSSAMKKRWNNSKTKQIMLNARRTRKMTKWSYKYDCCQYCGTIEIKHGAKGLCERCYSQYWRKGTPVRTLKRKGLNKFCIDCGKQLPRLGHKRCRDCHSKYNVGEVNPAYIHGECKRKYSNEFKKIRKDVIERDGHQCRICKVPDKEMSRSLSVHHIDYDKDNNNINNLVSLCCFCHVSTNRNRDYWQIILQSMIKERVLF